MFLHENAIISLKDWFTSKSLTSTDTNKAHAIENVSYEFENWYTSLQNGGI